MPHTPGPWVTTLYLREEDGLYSAILGPDMEVVVDPIDGDGEAFMRIDDADARLIAQAPAMYELLKELEFVEDGVTTWCPCCGENPPGHSSDCRLATVLKAVEGEESAR